jgi:hypothetical protein
MLDRLLSFLVALSLAILVWLYARSRDQEVLDNVPIPVQISLTPGQVDAFDLEVTGPTQVPISFRGPLSRIRELREMLQKGELRVEVAVVVPEDRLNESRYLDTVRVDAADIHAPPGVTPLVVEGRNRIPVTLYRLVDRQLPVRLDPAPDERVSQLVLEPATVLVRGPQEILDRERSIPTRPYIFPGGTDAMAEQEFVSSGPVPLVSELQGRPVRSTPGAVRVHLTLQPRQKLYELTGVPVQFLCPSHFGLRPEFVDGDAAKIKLRVLGPAAAEPPAVVAFIDLTGRKFEAGLYPDEPIRLQLPKDTHLAQEEPRSGVFQLVPVGVESRDGRPGGLLPGTGAEGAPSSSPSGHDPGRAQK